MFFVKNKKIPAAVLALSLITSLKCTNFTADLFPAANDLRSTQTADFPGKTGATSLDFTLTEKSGQNTSFGSYIPSGRGIVLYFTMWCSVCASHVDHMRTTIIPFYPNVTFIVVDYVSGSLTEVNSLANNSGLINPPPVVVADLNDELENYFGGTMGKTVVIDSNFKIIMNEDYRNGDNLAAALSTLP